MDILKILNINKNENIWIIDKYNNFIDYNPYYINNEKCRLKDITSLLLDTGMAKESFNIISQGKIEDIISNKPSERRIIFEEAAGVLKYKNKKLELCRILRKRGREKNSPYEFISTGVRLSVSCELCSAAAKLFVQQYKR